MTNSPTSKRSMRKTYKIKFSPYLWVKSLDIATPLLHTVTEVIADVVDPDGGFCWLTNATIGERACHSSQSAAKNAIITLCEFGVARKLEGQERLDVLAAGGRFISPKEPLAVIELLIPASAYDPEDLARVNLMRAQRDLGLAPITPETRPDITGMVGTRAPRKDAGKAAPQRRTKDRRAAQAAYAEEQPSLYSVQDLMGPPEDPYEDAPLLAEAGAPLAQPGTPNLDPGEDQDLTPPGFQKPTPLGFRNPPPWVSETPNPYKGYPREADPLSSPSVTRDVQDARGRATAPDGTDFQDPPIEDNQPPQGAPGGDAPRPPAPRPEPDPVPPSPAELVVDSLLRETAHAQPLGDPVADRLHLVALAQKALDSGMTPSRLRQITSVGLHRLRAQWALSARLGNPESFASGAPGPFGGTPMGGPSAPPPLCTIHPECTTTTADGRCADCAEAEHQVKLARGEVEEFVQDADGIWRDHHGTRAVDTPGWEGATEDDISAEMATRARMLQDLAEAEERARQRRASIRVVLTKPTAEEQQALAQSTEHADAQADDQTAPF